MRLNLCTYLLYIHRHTQSQWINIIILNPKTNKQNKQTSKKLIPVILFSLFYDKENRFRGLKWLALDHPSNRCQSWDLSPIHVAPELEILILTPLHDVVLSPPSGHHCLRAQISRLTVTLFNLSWQHTYRATKIFHSSVNSSNDCKSLLSFDF